MKKKNNRLSKRYQSDFINAYRGVDQNKVRSYDLLNNRSRVRTTKGRRDQVEPVLENTFKREVPQTASKQMYYGVHPSQSKPVKYMGPRVEDGEIVPTIHVERPEETEAREEFAPNKIWLPTPRRAAEIRANEIKPKTLYTTWMSERHQRMVSYNEIVLKKLPGLSIRLLFQGQEWMIVQETEKLRFISRIYATRQEAYRAYGKGTIDWIEQQKI